MELVVVRKGDAMWLGEREGVTYQRRRGCWLRRLRLCRLCRLRCLLFLEGGLVFVGGSREGGGCDDGNDERLGG